LEGDSERLKDLIDISLIQSHFGILDDDDFIPSMVTSAVSPAISTTDVSIDFEKQVSSAMYISML